MKFIIIFGIFFIILCLTLYCQHLYLANNADIVKCNLLWCDYTYLNNISNNIITESIHYKSCFINNELVNCS